MRQMLFDDELALLAEAGRREGGASSAVDFLFSAAKGCQTDLPVVLLRAHAAREGLVESITKGCKTGGGLRVLIQSYDAFASVRASESGVPVLTSDEWSHDMARAIFLPRFIPEQEAQDWPAVWEAVGGHPAHLRQLSELIVEERKVIEAERLKEEKEEEKAERHRQKLRPDRNPDAEEYLEIAKQQSRDDSFRADAKQPEGAVELVLRRLPELMKEEVDAVERQLQRFAVHPSLPGTLPSGSGKRVAALNLKLKELAEGVAVEGGGAANKSKQQQASSSSKQTAAWKQKEASSRRQAAGGKQLQATSAGKQQQARSSREADAGKQQQQQQANSSMEAAAGKQQEASSRKQAAGGKQQQANSSRQTAAWKQQEASSSRQTAAGKQQHGNSSRQAAGSKQQEASSSRQAAAGKQQHGSSRQAATTVPD
eukprot:s1056_g12.t1